MSPINYYVLRQGGPPIAFHFRLLENLIVKKYFKGRLCLVPLDILQCLLVGKIQTFKDFSQTIGQGMP